MFDSETVAFVSGECDASSMKVAFFHRSSPPAVLTHPLGSGLKRSSEALEAAATVRAWGAATTGLCGLGGCSDCEGA